MISIKVSDLGYEKCHYIARGNDVDEVLESFYSHSRKDHPEFVKNITLSKKREIRDKVKKILSSSKK